MRACVFWRFGWSGEFSFGILVIRLSRNCRRSIYGGLWRSPLGRSEQLPGNFLRSWRAIGCSRVVAWSHELTRGDPMKCGARVALGVAGGYFLGRTKKMKLALMLGGIAAGRRGGSPGGLLGRGTALLDSSPELAALRDQISGRLVEAGKGAVMGLAARQLESLTDRVSDRVESLGDPDRLTGRRPGRRRRPSNGSDRPDSSADRDDRDEDATEAADEYPSDDDYAGDESGGDQDEADSGRTRSSAPSRSRAGSSTGSSRTRASTRGTRAAGRTSAEPASGARRAGKAASGRSGSAAGSGTRNANARSGRGGRSER